MFKGIGNIASLLNQARNLGKAMGEVSEKLKAQRVTGTAGGGMISVHANGLGRVLSVEFDRLMIEQSDSMIQDLLPAAINDAIEKAKALHVEAMQSVTGGLRIPGGMEAVMKQLAGNLEPEQQNPDVFGEREQALSEEDLFEDNADRDAR